MFLTKLGNEHTCESGIYTYQNAKLIQLKCNIEYYPDLNPEQQLLNAGRIIYSLVIFHYHGIIFAQQIDEIPKAYTWKQLCHLKED